MTCDSSDTVMGGGEALPRGSGWTGVICPLTAEFDASAPPAKCLPQQRAKHRHFAAK